MSFKNNFRQNFVHQVSSDRDALASISIDWFPKDPDKEGKVIAEVCLTKQGSVMVSWRANTERYYTNKAVLRLIEENEEQLLTEYPNLKVDLDDSNHLV